MILNAMTVLYAIIVIIDFKPSNCIVTKLDRQQMQGNDVMSLLYFDINLYHLRTRRDTGSRDLNTARLYNSITT